MKGEHVQKNRPDKDETRQTCRRTHASTDTHTYIDAHGLVVSGFSSPKGHFELAVARLFDTDR